MAFCINCGHELAEGAKFCSNCGTATGGLDNSKRNSVFDGELHKCPQCGEVLSAFVSRCPSCGLELRGTKTSNSVRYFVEKLENADSETDKLQLIRNSLIPNTKEDVWEFMILASTNISSTESSELRKAWNAKFEQSYQKAKLILSDEDLIEITDLYNATVKKIKATDIAQGTKAAGKAIGSVFSRLISTLTHAMPKIIIFFIRNILAVLSLVAYLKAIQIDRLGENGVGYELLGGFLAVFAVAVLYRRDSKYSDLLFVGCVGGLHFYLARMLDNGVLFQISGFFTLAFVLCAFIVKCFPDNDKGE